MVYFFPKKEIFKIGFDWQGTATRGFEATYQSLMPYVGFEYFLNETIRVEPQLRHVYFKADEEIRTLLLFEVIKNTSSSLIFEVKFRTLNS